VYGGTFLGPEIHSAQFGIEMSFLAWIAGFALYASAHALTGRRRLGCIRIRRRVLGRLLHPGGAALLQEDFRQGVVARAAYFSERDATALFIGIGSAKD